MSHRSGQRGLRSAATVTGFASGVRPADRLDALPGNPQALIDPSATDTLAAELCAPPGEAPPSAPAASLQPLVLIATVVTAVAGGVMPMPEKPKASPPVNPY